jgi:hypothetical protein
MPNGQIGGLPFSSALSLIDSLQHATSQLTCQAVGVCVRLLHWHAHHGSLPPDLPALAAIASAPPERLASVWPQLESLFPLAEGGRARAYAGVDEYSSSSPIPDPETEGMMQEKKQIPLPLSVDSGDVVTSPREGVQGKGKSYPGAEQKMRAVLAGSSIHQRLLAVPGFLEAWRDFIAARFERPSRFWPTARAAQRILDELEEFPEVAVQSLNAAIICNWLKPFPATELDRQKSSSANRKAARVTEAQKRLQERCMAGFDAERVRQVEEMEYLHYEMPEVPEV